MALKPFKSFFLQTPSEVRRCWAFRAQRVCHFALLFFVVLLPYGRAFQEIGSIVAMTSLVAVYLLDYRGSNLVRSPERWLFFLLAGFLVFKTVHSIDMARSWTGLQSASYHGALLFLVGVEAVRTRQDARWVVFAFTALCCMQGAVGILQYFLGGFFPWMHGQSPSRLSGTFDTARVGNLMGISLPVLFALFWCFPEAWGRGKRIVMTAVLFFPGVFLLIGSQARSGIFGFSAALGLFFLLSGVWKKAKVWISLLALISATGVLLFIFTPAGRLSRFTLDGLRTDPRMEIWGDALEVFSRYPILGSGLNTFLTAKQSLGITDGRWSHITHPHGTYFQLLAETGLIGLAVFLTFMAFVALCAVKTLQRTRAQGPPFWRWTISALLCAQTAYLVTSISAHNFVHTWWIGLPFAAIGLLVGSGTASKRENDPLVAESDKKPVLFRVTNNLDIGGIQKRLCELLPLLTDEFDVHVVTYRKKGILFDKLAEKGVQTHFIPIKGKWNPLGILALAGLFAKHKADIVHTHSFGANITGILAAWVAGVRVRIAQVHLSNLHWYGKSGLRRKKQILEEKIIHNLFTQKILFVSEDSMEYFRKNTGLPAYQCEVLHNGINLQKEISADLELRRKFCQKKDYKLLGFVGRIAPGKGCEDFINIIYRLVFEDKASVRGIIVGNGPLLNKMIKKSEELQVNSSISFIGEVENVFPYYTVMDALLFLSEEGTEGMPGVVIEAASCSIPIIARKTTALTELKRYYNCIELNDTANISQSIFHYSASIICNNEHVVNEFSIKSMEIRTVYLYKKILSNEISN